MDDESTHFAKDRLLALLTADTFFRQQGRVREEVERACVLWMTMQQERRLSAAGEIRQALRRCVCFLVHLLCTHGCVLYVEDPEHMLRIVRAAHARVDAIAPLCVFTYRHARDDYRDIVRVLRRCAPGAPAYRRQDLQRRVREERPSRMWREYFAAMATSCDNMRTQTMYVHFVLNTRRVRGHAHAFWVDDTRMLQWSVGVGKWELHEGVSRM